MNLDRVEKYVVIIGGIIGALGGGLGLWIYYKAELVTPPTFQIIGMQFVDENGKDINDLTESNSADWAKQTIKVRFQLAFKYYNSENEYVHPTSLDPIIKAGKNTFDTQEKLNKFNDKSLDNASCHLKNIEGSVPPKTTKKLICKTVGVDLHPDEHRNQKDAPLNTNYDILYQTWVNACAVAINSTDTNDANLPTKYPFRHSDNTIGDHCVEDE